MATLLKRYGFITTFNAQCTNIARVRSFIIRAMEPIKDGCSAKQNVDTSCLSILLQFGLTWFERCRRNDAQIRYIKH